MFNILVVGETRIKKHNVILSICIRIATTNIK